MEKATGAKIEVSVGAWDSQGTFTGRLVRFSGEEIGGYTEYYGRASSSDDRGTEYTLYRTPEGRYRVHVETWSRWEGEGSYAQLLPNSTQQEDAHETDALQYGQPTEYRTYSEEEARARFPQVFPDRESPGIVEVD